MATNNRSDEAEELAWIATLAGTISSIDKNYLRRRLSLDYGLGMELPDMQPPATGRQAP